jgi:Arc/MetJ family transcription regulator
MIKRTNIELDYDLVDQALKLTNKKTMKEVVNYALEEVIRLNLRKRMLDMKGKVRWEGDLDLMRSI